MKGGQFYFYIVFEKSLYINKLGGEKFISDTVALQTRARAWSKLNKMSIQNKNNTRPRGWNKNQHVWMIGRR